MGITLTLSENEAEHLLYLVRTSNCLDHGPLMAPQKTTICTDIEVKIEAQMPRFDYEYENPHLDANGDVTNCEDDGCDCRARVETNTERIARLEYRIDRWIAKLEKGG